MMLQISVFKRTKAIHNTSVRGGWYEMMLQISVFKRTKAIHNYVETSHANLGDVANISI